MSVVIDDVGDQAPTPGEYLLSYCTCSTYSTVRTINPGGDGAKSERILTLRRSWRDWLAEENLANGFCGVGQLPEGAIH